MYNTDGKTDVYDGFAVVGNHVGACAAGNNANIGRYMTDYFTNTLFAHLGIGLTDGIHQSMLLAFGEVAFNGGEELQLIQNFGQLDNGVIALEATERAVGRFAYSLHKQIQAALLTDFNVVAGYCPSARHRTP